MNWQLIFFLDENILGTGNNLFLSTGSELFQHSWVSETITIINGEKRTGQSVSVSAYLYKKICGGGVPPPIIMGGGPTSFTELR